MSDLSRAIFCWDPVDLQQLIKAKRKDFETRVGWHFREDSAVIAQLSRRDLLLFCKRRIRTAEEIKAAIDKLVTIYTSPGNYILILRRVYCSPMFN